MTGQRASEQEGGCVGRLMWVRWTKGLFIQCGPGRCGFPEYKIMEVI